MDEPTAALGVKETGQVVDLTKRVRDRGLPVILISHDMPMSSSSPTGFNHAARQARGRRDVEDAFDARGGGDHDGRVVRVTSS